MNKNGVHLYSRQLNEGVAKLHLPGLGSVLTVVARADFAVVKVEGPLQGVKHHRC